MNNRPDNQEKAYYEKWKDFVDSLIEEPQSVKKQPVKQYSPRLERILTRLAVVVIVLGPILFFIGLVALFNGLWATILLSFMALGAAFFDRS